MKLKTKFMVLFIGLTILFLLVASAGGYFWVKRQVVSNVNREMESMVGSYANQLQIWSEDKAKTIEMLAFATQTLAGDRPIPKTIVKTPASDPDLLDLYIGLPDGKLYSLEDWVPPAGWDPRVRPWYKEAVQKQGLIFTEPYIDDMTGKYCMTIAMPVMTGDGRVRGVLAEDILLSTMTGNLAATKLRGEGYIILLDGNGQVLAHPDANLLGKKLADEPVYKQLAGDIMAGDKSGQLYKVGDTDMLVTAKKIANTNWTIAFVLPEAVLYGQLSALKYLPLAAAVVLLVMLWFMINAVSRPIENLQQLMEKVEAGDLAVRGEAKSTDEIGLLTRAINRTLDKLQALIIDSHAKVEYLNAVPSPVLAIDKEMNVVFINPAGARMLNQPLAACRGVKCYQLFKNENCRSVNCFAARVMQDNSTLTADTMVDLPAGSKPVRCTVCALKDPQGQITGAIEFLVDISEEQAAVATVNHMVEEALAGRLDFRGNPDQFKIGGFNKTIAEINGLLEAISRPIDEASGILNDVATGDLTARMSGEYQGKYAEIKAALNATVSHIQELVKNIKQAAADVDRASNRMVDVAGTLAANSEEVSAKTNTVSAATEQITASIGQTAAASNDTRKNITSIAAAAEQMSATIMHMAELADRVATEVAEVSELIDHTASGINNVAQSTAETTESFENVARAVQVINTSLDGVEDRCVRSVTISKDAADKSVSTRTIISQLNSSSKQIGKIVGIISNIAEQTNMLALNATIEAAGAGEAGKGFAVVANEVKELAKRTARATEEIGQQIEDMQTNMAAAVGAVDKIGQVIGEISDITNNIAAAVTEQSTSVSDITAAIDTAAQKINLINREISDIGKNTENAAGHAVKAAQDVKQIALSSSQIAAASEEVARNTEQSSQLVEQVASSAAEISVGATEIVGNLTEIDAASRESATQAVETSEAAGELAKTAAQLGDSISRFKI